MAASEEEIELLRKQVSVLSAGFEAIVQQQSQSTLFMHEMRRDVADKFTAGAERMTSIEAEVAQNTAITSEIRDILAAGRVGLRVLGGIGTAVKWLGYMATAAAALYTGWYMLTHDGRPPGK